DGRKKSALSAVSEIGSLWIGIYIVTDRPVGLWRGRDAVFAAAEHPPEGMQVAGFGKHAAHANDGNGLGRRGCSRAHSGAGLDKNSVNADGQFRRTAGTGKRA